MTITKLVERLRDCCVVSNDTLYGDAASMLETLWAECEAGRESWDADNPVMSDMAHAKVKEARRATDAAVGSGE